MNKPHAHYTTHFDNRFQNVVFVLDANDGSKTVTNDAEAVVTACLLKWPGHRIIYRDTDKVWSELGHNGKKFTFFKQLTEQEKEAIERLWA